MRAFNGPFPGTTQVNQYEKGKTNQDFTEARDSEWQWHQLGRMQVCTSLQTATPAPHHSVFYRPDAFPAAQPTASKHWRHNERLLRPTDIFIPHLVFITHRKTHAQNADENMEEKEKKVSRWWVENHCFITGLYLYWKDLYWTDILILILYEKVVYVTCLE